VKAGNTAMYNLRHYNCTKRRYGTIVKVRKRVKLRYNTERWIDIKFS